MNNDAAEQIRMNEEQETTYYLKPLLAVDLPTLTPAGMVQPVLDGFKSPITALEELHHLEKLIKEARTLIEDDAAEEIAKYGKMENPPTVLGYKIGIRAGRRIFKFADPTIKVAEQRLKELKECAKKGLPTSDGELLEAPTVTHTKDSITFTKTGK